MTDARLAELMNWMLLEISRAEIPIDFRPYTTEEVAGLRAQPLADVEGMRAELIAQMPDHD